jgi:hypothetical protein
MQSVPPSSTVDRRLPFAGAANAMALLIGVEPPILDQATRMAIGPYYVAELSLPVIFCRKAGSSARPIDRSSQIAN